jgi:ATP-dependent protease ClpP protease subunit
MGRRGLDDGERTVLRGDAECGGGGRAFHWRRYRFSRCFGRRRQSLWLVVLCVMTVFRLSGAEAAQISVTSEESGPPLITIRGELALPDAIDFMRKASSMKDAVVVLRSPGGNLMAGLQIGRTIRQRGFLTVIPASAGCSSACALAWLGGKPRFMTANSRIGFHAAYFMKSNRARTSAVANSAIADYLRELQLSERAIRYVTSMPPEKMTWLTVGAAHDLGIEAGIYAPGAVMSTLDSLETGSTSTVERLASFDLLGFDLPGMPIANSTLTDCEGRCEENSLCGAFTFNTKSSACFLKSGAEFALSNPVAISGYQKLPKNGIRRIEMTIKEATDYPGNDIDRQKGMSFEACVIACSEEETCSVFTYVTRRRECWLKNAEGSAEPREGLVSGVK